MCVNAINGFEERLSTIRVYVIININDNLYSAVVLKGRL